MSDISDKFKRMKGKASSVKHSFRTTDDNEKMLKWAMKHLNIPKTRIFNDALRAYLANKKTKAA